MGNLNVSAIFVQDRAGAYTQRLPVRTATPSLLELISLAAPGLTCLFENVVTTVDVYRHAGDGAGTVAGEEGAQGADVINRQWLV
jgi:hypothetical protein